MGRKEKGKTGIEIPEAIKEAARARLLALSEAESNSELLEKVSQARSPAAAAATATAPAGVSEGNGVDKDDWCRSKLMALSDTLPCDTSITGCATATAATAATSATTTEAST